MFTNFIIAGYEIWSLYFQEYMTQVQRIVFLSRSISLSLYTVDAFDDIINKSLQLNWHTIFIGYISCVHGVVFGICLTKVFSPRNCTPCVCVHSTHSLYYALAHRNNEMNGIWYDHEWLAINLHKRYVCTMYVCTYIRLCASVATCHFWFWLFAVVAVQWKMVNWKCIVCMHKIWYRWAHWHSLRIEGDGDFRNWHL